MWLSGPPWLPSESLWPEWKPTDNLQLQVSLVEAEEAAQPATPSSAAMEDTGLHRIIDVSTYNRLSHLLNVTAYVLRFVRNTRKPSIRYTGPISPAESTQASLKWIQSVQRQSFTPEILNLTSKSSRLPLVRQLNLFLDKGGLIRCGVWQEGCFNSTPIS